MMEVIRRVTAFTSYLFLSKNDDGVIFRAITAKKFRQRKTTWSEDENGDHGTTNSQDTSQVARYRPCKPVGSRRRSSPPG